MLMLNGSPSLQGVMHSPLCDKCAEYNGGTIPGKELWRKGKMLMHSSPAKTVKLDVWIELAAGPNELAGPDE